MEKFPLELKVWPDKILRKKCRKAEKVDFNIRGLLDKMFVMMRKHQGVGLAGPQAGIDLALVVIQAGDKVFRLVNPEIIRKKGKIRIEEGCLSFPGISLGIKRAETVWVSYLDETGDPVTLEAEGVLSVILQHEIDHINGIVFIDRAGLAQRLKNIPGLLRLLKSGRPS